MGAFRSGVLAETAGSVEAVAATARRAEELGYDTVLPPLLRAGAATPQQLSGGRFELGLGTGWLRIEYEAAGMAFDRAGSGQGRHPRQSVARRHHLRRHGGATW